MNKKGFTLMELIAVIAIIGILGTIVTPAVIRIRKDILKGTLNSKISLIESAARDYGADHIRNIPSILVPSAEDSSNFDNPENCLNVVVKTLISDGYLAAEEPEKEGDDVKTIIRNPVTEESMNFEVVCIRFSSNMPRDRKIIADIVDKEKLFDVGDEDETE